MWLKAWLSAHPEERRDIGLAVLLALEAAFIFVVVPLVEMERSLLLLHLFQGALATVTAAAIAGSGRTRAIVAGTFALTLAAPTLRDYGSPLAAQFLFNMVLTWVVAGAVFRAENVTHHRILGAAAVYLNIAWLFGMVYRESAALLPGAFSRAAPRLDQLLSFSLGALTTGGTGELEPMHPLVRSLASLESVVGQFFLAVLVARLMGLHLAQRASRKP